MLCSGGNGSVGGGDVGDGGLVGGVDTEMYRTGHPHACSINLIQILLPQLLWRTQGAKRCAPSGVTMWSLARDFSH